MKVIENYLPVFSVMDDTEMCPLCVTGSLFEINSYGFYVRDIFHYYYIDEQSSYRICREV